MSTVALPLARPLAQPIAPVGNFARPLTTALILGAFAFVTLPLAALVMFRPVMGVVWLYLWLFGMTHFVLTFTIYLQSKNLRHFTKSWKNIAIFCVAPVAVFAFFDIYQALQVAVLLPLVHLAFRSLVRMVDFFHWARQSFGVLQLFKAESGCGYPAWLKRTENRFFLVLTALLGCTFFEGVRSLADDMPVEQMAWQSVVFPLLKPVDASDPWSIALCVASAVLLAAAVALLAALLTGYAWAERRGRSVRKSVLYLLAQTASAALAIVFLPLYLATLAMHYVEYHVVMAPRCFQAALDPRSPLDRWFDALRRRPILFYGVIIGVAGAAMLVVRESMDAMAPGVGDVNSTVPYLLLVSIFDGIFVFHYFVEAFIWKFSDPYFRQSMAGMYFPPKADGRAPTSGAMMSARA